MRFAIERPVIKASIVLAGIPITALALLGLIDSLGLLLGGLERSDPWPLSFGVGMLLSFVGLLGAWLRVLRPYEQLSVQRINRIRRWLIAGIAGGGLLAIGTLGMFSIDFIFVALAFILLSSIGLLLLRQTPTKQPVNICT